MNKKGFINIILMIIIIVIIVGIIGYFLLIKKPNSTSNLDIYANNDEIENTNTPSNNYDLQSWQTYQDDEVGIRFKYPDGWTVWKEISEYNNRIYIENKKMDYSKISDYSVFPKDFLSMWIDYRRPSSQTYSFQENLNHYRDILAKEEIIEANSVNIYVYEFGYNPMSEMVGAGPYIEAIWEDNSFIYGASTRDSIYKEMNEKKVDILRKILSTIESLNSYDLQSWQTYQDDEDYFSFSYPQNFSLEGLESGGQALFLVNELGEEIIQIGGQMRNIDSEYQSTLEKNAEHLAGEVMGMQGIENILMEKIIDSNQVLGYLSQWKISTIDGVFIATRSDFESKTEGPSISEFGRFKKVFSLEATRDFDDLELFRLISSTFRFNK